MTILQTIVLVAEVGVALAVGYLLLLTVAAFFARRTTASRGAPPSHRFIIMVPAHNEERLLPGLLASLCQLDYPSALYAVHVVADNCTDQTAVLGRQGSATVHERHDTTNIGKGYALEWLLQEIWRRDEPHDAIIILDADSIVSKNFLAVMDARLARGERVIQGYYAVRNPAESWSTALRAVALIAVHYLRPLGRMVIGGSTGLKGNGMAFHAEIVRRHRWSASLTEDIEYHMALLLAGERATFAPDAVVWAEMPSTLAAANTQNARWERGRMEMVRTYVPRLLRNAIQRRSFVLFDAAVEQLIPPFSIVALASAACFVAALLVQSTAAITLGVALFVAQAVYVVGGLVLARAPRKVYQALLYAPVFVLWKLWLYVRVLLGLDQKGWIRTARNDS